MKRTLSLKREQLAELTYAELAAVQGGQELDISLQTCPKTVCDTITLICYSTFCPTEG